MIGLRRISIFLSITQVVGICCLLSGCKPNQAPQAKTELPSPVRVIRVEPMDQVSRYTYAGEITPRTETALSFRIGGKVMTRPVEVGSTIRRGSEIATLDPQDMRLQTDAMSSQLQAAQADYALAQANLDRYRTLLDKKFISPAEFDRRSNAVAVMAARKDELKSRLLSTHNQVFYTRLLAEDAGVVTATEAERGQVVGAGQTIVRVARIDEAEAVISVPENRLNEFKLTKEVKVSLWANPDQSYRGAVREISPLADPATRTYRARISIHQPDENVRFGMTATVSLSGETVREIFLPLSTLYHHQDKVAVWVVDPRKHTVNLVDVETSSFDIDRIGIKSGLNGGELVVQAGVHKLHQGQKVRILPSEQTAEE
ncbi:macrolide export protein MacA [mine drainage metagenome]|uniref:Macrolide export protein MacA n=1 Tax=mine drainage metagenome TaxID=410659 RepID=A0A1J5QM03_9ZZZZ